MRYFSKIFGGLSWNVFQWIQIILNILYVFQSVSYLTYLLNICQYRNISSSWYIFLKFLDIFPGYFWNISRLFEFLYVCQSVSPSLISLPICHFWGSTSETSGLVRSGKPRPPYFFGVKMILFEYWDLLPLMNLMMLGGPMREGVVKTVLKIWSQSETRPEVSEVDPQKWQIGKDIRDGETDWQTYKN